MMRLNPVFLKLEHRVKSKRGLNIAICGEPGIGKSRRGLRVGEIFDKNGFNNKKIVYSGEKLIEFLLKFVKDFDAVMWDENIGGGEATSWYTEENKAVKRSMQIMRKKCVTFIQCIPSLLDIQPGCRRLFHVYIEPIKFFPKQDGYLCKVMRIQHNPQNKITYFKYFRVRDPRNPKKRVRVKFIFISNAKDNKLIEVYETESSEFKDMTHEDNLNIIREEKKRKSKDWGVPPDIENHVLTILNNIECVKKELYPGNTYLDLTEIRNICRIGEKTAKRVRTEVENRLKRSK